MRTSRGNASGLSGVDEKNRRMRNVVGPTTSSVLTICSRNPATIDAMAMTVAIPMTTPRIVSPERWVDAEHDAHADAEAERHGHRPRGHARGQRGCELDQRRQRAAGEESGDATEQREDGRLRQELTPDVAPRRAE